MPMSSRSTNGHLLRTTGRPLRSAAVVALLALALVACGGSSGDDEAGEAEVTTTLAEAADLPPTGAAAAAIALKQGRTVIDVRTPEEYEAMHIEDAVLMDIQDPGFDQALSELAPVGRYVVYCRTGNRSAAATERMRDAGLDVLDGGSLDDMVAAMYAVTVS